MPRTIRSGRPKSLSVSTLCDVLNDRNLRLFILRMKPGDQWHLFEFLFNKALLEVDSWNEMDSLLIVELYVNLTFYAERDSLFFKQRWFALEAARGFVKSLRLGVKAAKLRIDRRYMGSLELHPNQYFGLKFQNRFKDSREFIQVWRMGRYRKFETAYIGVGYKDKGNCRNIAMDGTPSFAEVASDWWYQHVVLAQKPGKKLIHSWADPPHILPQWDTW